MIYNSEFQWGSNIQYMNYIKDNFGLQGEPPKGVIYEDLDEGIKLTYDPNDQMICFWEDDLKFEHLDCSYFSDWKSVKIELASEYGIVI